ncbi:cell envelope integrity protein CreD [Sphingomonas canadensis]|uniref:Cell envelope integrity protein CreD n=1 Tax=Sphingomonas canadensis TaxID=1219257 RepID=A0ABW3H657_9SPHN|nr:cell envelope integrity protein CreD [Sphingomonas canadensis]MCW3835321.1 cell envelope integrity protein CreD [Sphingomonas canadensis]
MESAQNPLLKLLITSIVGAILAVPLFMVFLLVYDREKQSETARSSIAEGWGGPQRVAGPVIVLPFSRPETVTVKENGRDVTRTVTVKGELQLVPASLQADTALQPERRARSIYQTVVYGAELRGRARFMLPAADLARLQVDPATIAFDRAELRFGVSDPRALTQVGRLVVAGTPRAPQPGNGPAATGGAGFFVPLDAAALREGAIDAEFQLGFRGHTELTLVPRAGQTEWTVRSSWPHPSFTGGFLPESPRIDGTGFAATYRISNLALGATLLTRIGDPAPAGQAGAAEPPADARVTLVQPVDVYSQVTRAAKYGFLFIGFTFLAFLMFDVVGGHRVSPVEYLLVGAGLVLFFVMLLAMAEVIGFATAYLAAAGAIVALLTAYSAAVLRSWGRALLVALLLAGLYGALYVLLSLEAYSLLIGSGLLFLALAAVMYLTRNLEWNAREVQEAHPAAA